MKIYIHKCDNCKKIHFITSSQWHRLNNGKQKKCYCSKVCANNVKTNRDNVVCDNCGKIFSKTKHKISVSKNNFCCRKCTDEYRTKINRNVRKCEFCENYFETTKSSKKRFCNTKCQNEWQKTNVGIKNKRFTRVLIKCDYCDKEFCIKKYKLEQENHFCSTNCRQNWFKNTYSQLDETKDKSRETALKMLEDGKFSHTNTKPQLIVNEILGNMNIDYINEYNVKYYSIDNYLSDYDLFIEVQGDYWHCNPIKFEKPKNKNQKDRIVRDKAKHKYIKNKYNTEILYLWEYDIIHNIELVKYLIETFVKNKGFLYDYNSYNYKLINNNLELDIIKNL